MGKKYEHDTIKTWTHTYRILRNQPSEVTCQIFLDEDCVEHNWTIIDPWTGVIYNFVQIEHIQGVTNLV